MKALWHINSSKSEIRQEPISSHGEQQIQSLYSLVSCGTEFLVARGLVPEQLFQSMRVPYMDGDFSFPVKYGYSLVGRLADTNKIGHVMHPHQDVCLINATDFFEIPQGVPAKRAILASNLETALTAVWDAGVLPGERVTIIGFGLIGSLVARIVQDIPGVTLSIIEINSARKALAEEMGFEVSSFCKPNSFDTSFHCSGTEGGLQTAIDCVGHEGKVVEMSWYGSQTVSLNLGGDFHSNRKKLIASQVSHIPSHMTARWDHHRRKAVVFDLLQNAKYDTHITHEITLDEAADLFNAARTTPLPGLGYCIKY
jgi:threonine dehydrogenase-like Zn-dependent dehydrogenase